MTHSMRL
nr:Chain 7, ermDL [Escherichia coli]7NSP_7 Chain 7, ermDL [Escherichia coli]7NSQ_7 Chain 7, ermDL [Escherichia coli]